MTNEEKIDHWISYAEYDKDTTKAMLDSNRYFYVVITAQQVMEKLLKAYYIKIKGKEPPRTHDIVRLSKELNVNFSEEQLNLFDKLFIYYHKQRYPDYIRKYNEEITKDIASDIYKNFDEVYKWLLSQMK